MSIPYKEKVKDGQTVTEYKEDQVQDSVFESILKQAYKMFKVGSLSIRGIHSMNQKNLHALH